MRAKNLGLTRARSGLLSGLMLLLAVLGCDAGEPAAERPLALDFTLPVLGGEALTLSNLRGRPVLVDFWATWCAPCVSQIPLFNKFHATHGSEIALLAVATDTEGDEVVAPFAAEHGIEYPVLLGSEALAREWGLLGFPTLFVIDAEGAIQEAHVGPLSEEDLMEIAAHLKDAG